MVLWFTLIDSIGLHFLTSFCQSTGSGGQFAPAKTGQSVRSVQHGQQWFDFTGKDIKGVLTERGKSGPSDHLPPILPDHLPLLTINE